MKNSLIIHAVWLLVSIAAFAIGGKVLAPKSTESDAGSDQRNRLSALPENAGGGTEEKVVAVQKSAGAIGYESALETLANGGSPADFVEAFVNEGDALTANKMFADLLLNVTGENAREIFDALQENGLGDGNFGRDMNLFLQAWGRIDGPKAIAAVEELGGDGRRRMGASLAAMEGWATSDVDGAKTYLAESEADGWQKGMMTQGLISGMAKLDPEAATAFVLELDAERAAAGENDESDRWRGYAIDRQMEVIAEAQLRRGPAEARKWAEGLPDGTMKAAAFDQVVENYVKSDPAAAAEWVQSHAAGDYAQRAVREIAEEFGRTDPEAAIRWAEKLPEESQGNALAETLEQWTRSDPLKASEYLQNMEPSSTRDAAVQSFARQLDREDPASAADWAATISDAGERNETLRDVGRSWMRSDPEAAKAWLPSSGLSEEEQKSVIENPGRRGWGR